jgi:hypothetical protein
LKAPLAKGTKGAYLGAKYQQTSMALEDPLTNEFCAIRDYRTFKAFAKHGSPMLQRYLASIAEKQHEEEGFEDGTLEQLVSMFRVWSDDDSFLLAIWEILQTPVKKWQGELQALMKMDKGCEEYWAVIERAFKKADVTIIKGPRNFSPLVTIHCKGLLESCILQIAWAEEPLATCDREGCGKVFIQHESHMKYCSPFCKGKSKTGEWGEVEQEKNRMRARVHWLFKNNHISAKQKQARLKAIKEARVLPGLQEIATRYHLEARKDRQQAKKISKVSQNKRSGK